MVGIHNIKFPRKQNIGSNCYFEYDSNSIKSFNTNLNKTQLFLDKKVGDYLQKYVSFKDGTQEKSIVNAGTYGTGKVMINVLYAHYQAYSPKIKKRAGLRGTYPFERMKADKNSSILEDVSEYSRRINDGQ